MAGARLALLGPVAAGWLLGACQGAVTVVPPTFEVVIHVESDPGQPLAGAQLFRSGKAGPLTGQDGRVKVALGGVEGTTVDIVVKCPPDYLSPTAPLVIPLKRIADGRLAEYTTSCPPTLRRVVVAVRADNGPFLPVTYLGKPVGRTDANGSATLLFQMRPGESIDLAFDTTEAGYERIRPRTPSFNIVVRPFDDVVTLDQKFSWIPKPKIYHPPPPKPHKL